MTLMISPVSSLELAIFRHSLPMTFGLSEHAADGVERYMCIDPDAVRSGMMLGLQGILDEVASNGTETDKECLHYARRQ